MSSLLRVPWRLLGILGATMGVLCCAPKGKVANPNYVRTTAEIEWDLHHLAELDDRKADALNGYDQMCQRKPAYVRACFDYARLLFDMPDTDRARAALTQILIRFPGDANAQSGVKRLATSYAVESEYHSGITALQKLTNSLKGTEIHDTLLFEIARLQRYAKNRDEELETLKNLLRSFDRWNSQLWDDAVWRMAALYRAQSDWKSEKKMLIKLLNEQESSWLIGSYTSPYHDDALYRLGDVLLQKGSHNEAFKVFSSLSKMQSSRLKDEGVLGMARVRAAAGDNGAACVILDGLINEETARSALKKARKLASTICR